MESPKSFRINKRRFESVVCSPDNSASSSVSKRNSIRKIKFSLDSVQDSPVSLLTAPVATNTKFQYIDENSCGSAFSDRSDEEELSQATTCGDDSFSFKSIESETSFDLYDKFDSELTIESPFMSFGKLNKTTKSKSSNDLVKSVHKSEFNEQSIKHALETEVADSDRLIGDMSRTHTLPILENSKHNDLASISPQTLTDLINGNYNDKIGKFMILDARYPYEYNGGHIANAESAYVKESMIEKLFNTPITSPDGKPVVLVFHCEFSIERGPKLMREIREKDRALNKASYPNLFYPEIYLLEGGYKNFYESNESFCEPKSYLPMLHDNHRNELKFFRKKSKTWEMDTRKSKLNTKTKLSF